MGEVPLQVASGVGTSVVFPWTKSSDDPISSGRVVVIDKIDLINVQFVIDLPRAICLQSGETSVVFPRTRLPMPRVQVGS